MKVVSFISKSGKVKTITIEELKKMKIELTQMWEEKCTHCGKCCFEKKVTEKGVWLIDYSKPCEFLKFVGRKSQCLIYSDRFDKANCNTIPEAIQKRYLPPDCPYIQAVPVYKAPIDNGSMYKKARNKLSRYSFRHRYDEDEANAGTPCGGSATFALPAPPPVREDLEPDWKRRKNEQEARKAGGKAGILDPREKNPNLSRKPSGYLGGD